MIIEWWLYLLDGMRHCVIRTGAIEKVLVMTNKLMNIGFNYYEHRLKSPP